MAKAASIPRLLKNLWEEDFFVTGKELSEVSGGLAAKGYHFRKPSLSTALMRAVQSGFLAREKKAGKWKYIQKHPAGSQPGQRTELFSRYDLHPRIKEVSFKQFEDGNFKEAAQNAFVEVVDYVKKKTRGPKDMNGRELDGDSLMNHVFGCDNQQPKVRFNSLKNSLDKAEQRGMMNLYKGIVGLRDKKAHLNFIQKDPVRALEYLSLASLLLRLLDERRVSRRSSS